MTSGKQLYLFKHDQLNTLRTRQDYIDYLKRDNISNKEIMKIIEISPFEDINIRLIKLLGSRKDKSLVPFFINIINNKDKKYSNKESIEAVSSIGRMRDKDINEKYLVPLIKNKNPEIILQVIRALLVFKKEPNIEEKLKKIYEDTNNEIIKDILDVEFKFNKLDYDTPTTHTQVNPKYKNKVINVDVLEFLNEMDKNQIHLTFTSPPYYNARDYSTYFSYEEYLDFLEEVFKEVYRVTKDGRFLVVNTSPVIIPRAGRKYSSKRYPIPFDLHNRLVNNGWEFIDDIIWKKSEASVKNRIGNFMQYRKPLTYKPNTITEYVMVYRKKSHKLIDWNLKSYPEDIMSDSLVKEPYESNNVWEIEPSIDSVHSAVFPKKLCDNIVKYYSLRGDLVFDPFAGSGTLGKVALENERNILLTEINETYYDRIKDNLNEYSTKIEYIKKRYD